MIKLDKSGKLAESASLVIKSPIIAFQSKIPEKYKQDKKVIHIQNDSIPKEGNSNASNNYMTTPKKHINETRRHETSVVEQDRRLNSVNARRNYYEVKTNNTVLSQNKQADQNEEISHLYSYKGGPNSKHENDNLNNENSNSIVT